MPLTSNLKILTTGNPRSMREANLKAMNARFVTSSMHGNQRSNTETCSRRCGQEQEYFLAFSLKRSRWHLLGLLCCLYVTHVVPRWLSFLKTVVLSAKILFQYIKRWRDSSENFKFRGVGSDEAISPLIRSFPISVPLIKPSGSRKHRGAQ